MCGWIGRYGSGDKHCMVMVFQGIDGATFALGNTLLMLCYLLRCSSYRHSSLTGISSPLDVLYFSPPLICSYRLRS